MKPQTTGYLPTTSISFLANLERSGNDEKLIHLGIFFERYRSGLCKVLAGRANLGPQDAEEIVHEFLVKKLVDGEFISKYLSCLKQSGSAIRKFRPYLVTSIKRFATDYLRSRNRPIPEDLKHNLTIVDDDIGDLFTTEWLQELLAILFQETRRFFVESGRETHWQVFLRRSVEPIVLGSRPPSYEELADQYELESARAANNVWIVVLRKFKRVWGDVLANALQSGEDKEYRETMHELQSCLRMAGYIDMRRLLVNSVLASDSSTSTDSLDTEQFTSIFSLASNGFNEMMPIERELFFQCYLDTSLAEVLPEIGLAPTSDAPDNETTHRELGDRKLRDVLFKDDVDCAVLRNISQALKVTIQRRSGEVPPLIAGVLRFLVIASAFVKGGVHISNSPVHKLRDAMSDALTQYDWLCDGQARDLLEEFIQSAE